jgi:hypothetical protein
LLLIGSLRKLCDPGVPAVLKAPSPDRWDRLQVNLEVDDE